MKHNSAFSFAFHPSFFRVFMDLSDVCLHNVPKNKFFKRSHTCASFITQVIVVAVVDTKHLGKCLSNLSCTLRGPTRGKKDEH